MIFLSDWFTSELFKSRMTKSLENWYKIFAFVEILCTWCFVEHINYVNLLIFEQRNTAKISRLQRLNLMKVSDSWFSIKWFSCFFSWLFIKKIMQKNNVKVQKISIFSSFDVKLKFLMNQVELTQFSVKLSHVELNICIIQLELSWKCEQLDFKSSQIQNINLKLNLIISLTKINNVFIWI